MNKEFLTKLNTKYASEGLNLMQALKTWRSERLNPDGIRDQVRNDIGRDITAEDARELYHLGSSMKYDYDAIAKDFEVSKGREDLIPENFHTKSIQLSPSVKLSMERIGQNLYRDKKAKKYWTLKEKIGDGGQKAIYLVAVEEPDELKKLATQAPDMDAIPQNKEEITNPSDQNNQMAQTTEGPAPQEVVNPSGGQEVALGIRDKLPPPSGSKTVSENFQKLFGSSPIRDYGREFKYSTDTTEEKE